MQIWHDTRGKQYLYINSQHTYLYALSMDPEYNILRLTVKQTTYLMWQVSEPTNSKGDLASKLSLQAVITPS